MAATSSSSASGFDGLMNTVGEQSDDVFDALAGDFMKPKIQEVDQLLKLGVNVTVYSGQVGQHQQFPELSQNAHLLQQGGAVRHPGLRQVLQEPQLLLDTRSRTHASKRTTGACQQAITRACATAFRIRFLIWEWIVARRKISF
ncbi:Serine carboxypeptidase-like 51 [Zea mays]|uniref:Serine carboxypeptidase-like 51 n=1 Tax=Zea mays TaxID=4577 RepID=A0A3L6F0H6_MAIZE|nr:Serine carboxypeptidase-like 51 [Zea mays]